MWLEEVNALLWHVTGAQQIQQLPRADPLQKMWQIKNNKEDAAKKENDILGCKKNIIKTNKNYATNKLRRRQGKKKEGK